MTEEAEESEIRWHIEQIANKIMALTRGEPISGIVDVKRGY